MAGLTHSEGSRDGGHGDPASQCQGPSHASSLLFLMMKVILKAIYTLFTIRVSRVAQSHRGSEKPKGPAPSHVQPVEGVPGLQGH